MIYRRKRSIVSILDESPFFNQLSIKEMEYLVEDLLDKYPQLMRYSGNENEVGYETGWLNEKIFEY